MTVDSDVTKLLEFIDNSSKIFDTSHQLLQKSRSLMEGNSSDAELVKEVKKIQTEFILDSVRLNKFHKSYKDWENEYTSNFLNEEVRSYNKIYGESYRVNADIERLEEEYQKLRQSVKLPSFKFSIEAIKKLGDEQLLANLQSDESGRYPSIVAMSDLFSLDADSQLSTPDLGIFKRLLNLEYRLRIEKRVCYEVLQVVKNQQTSGNKKWTTRDTTLNDFITKKLGDVVSEIENIKKNEYEDLKGFNYYSGEEELDDEEQDELEQEIEEEEELDVKENGGNMEEEVPELGDEKHGDMDALYEAQTNEDSDTKTQAQEENDQTGQIEQIDHNTPQSQDEPGSGTQSSHPPTPKEESSTDDEMLVDI